MIMNALKTVRNNWKKTVALIAVCGFGVHYGDKKYRERLTLKAYCLEAKKYGEAKINGGLNRPRKVTVFLNPRANRSKGKELYEKNVAPLLHLAGLEVTLIQTEYEGQVKRYMEVLDPTDAIVIAGGDGSVSEVVTGLLRRPDEEQFSKTALGVIPIGETNTLAKSLCPPTESTVTFLAEMAMSIIKGVTRPVDVMQITSTEDKSVYAVSGLEWGAYTDSEMRKTKNWYFGPLKHRLAYVVTALRYWPPSYKASLSYSLPCVGCSRCYVPPPKPQWRWWHIFIPRRVEVVKDYSNVINDECGKVHQFSFTTSQLTAKTSVDQETTAGNQADVARSINLSILPEATVKSDFISDGWHRLKGEPLNALVQNLEVGEFTVEPDIPTNREAWFKIDNERFELMNMRCKLLPQKLRFMFSESLTVAMDSLTQTH